MFSDRHLSQRISILAICFGAISPFLLETQLGLGKGSFGLLVAGRLWLLAGSAGMLALGLGGRLATAPRVLPMAAMVVGCSLIVPIGLALPMQAFAARAGQASALTGFLQQEGSALLEALTALHPHSSQVPLAVVLLALALVVGAYGREP
ncbi:MAG: hypothetical protein ER33_07860 [Cyanobium sp. CACIAM 14]|nr:MAG: hypothetical protein ER33_07860 [Cyanobium sp. CACIAM 14]